MVICESIFSMLFNKFEWEHEGNAFFSPMDNEVSLTVVLRRWGVALVLSTGLKC